MFHRLIQEYQLKELSKWETYLGLSSFILGFLIAIVLGVARVEMLQGQTSISKILAHCGFILIIQLATLLAITGIWIMTLYLRSGWTRCLEKSSVVSFIIDPLFVIICADLSLTIAACERLLLLRFDNADSLQQSYPILRPVLFFVVIISSLSLGGYLSFLFISVTLRIFRSRNHP